MSALARLAVSIFVLSSIAFLAGCGGGDGDDKADKDKDATPMQHDAGDGGHSG